MDGFKCPNLGVIREFLKKESSQMIESDLLQSRMANFVQENLKWIRETIITRLKMKHITAYLAANYFTRALCTDIVLDNEHQYKILAMACCFIAVKLMEDRDESFYVPSLFTGVDDEQKAIVAMEVVVVVKLEWEFIVITPFDYLQFVMNKFDILKNLAVPIFNASSFMFCRTFEDGSFLGMRPSVIAAAVVMREAVKAGATIDANSLQSIYDIATEESVKQCCLTIDSIAGEKVAMPSTTPK